MPEELLKWMLTTGGGVGLVVVALRHLWPSLRDSLQGQSTQWRSENRYIAQLEAARERAVLGEAEAKAQVAQMHQTIAELTARITVMEGELRFARKQIARLSRRLGCEDPEGDCDE